METFKVTAPSRVDLAGGTLDIWPLYTFIGGAKTVNVAVDLTASATFEISPHHEFHMEIAVGNGAFSFGTPPSLEKIRALPPLQRFPVSVVSRYLSQKAELPPRRIRITFDSTIPPQSGLGGSSTLCITIIRGLARLFGDFIQLGWQWKMMEWARDMEASYLGVPTGTQDYLAALFGGVSCYSADVGHLDRISYPDEVFQGLSDRLLVLFSGEQHHSGISNWELIKGAIEGDNNILRGMASIKQIAEELDGELHSGNLSWKHIGQLLHAEWETRKTLFRVHTRRLDELIQFLQSRKVLGAKVCGAAQGGSLVALVDPDMRDAIARECQKNGIDVLNTRATKVGVLTS